MNKSLTDAATLVLKVEKDFAVLFALIIVALMFVYRGGISITIVVFLTFGSIIGLASLLFSGLPSSRTMREQITTANVMTVRMDRPRLRDSVDGYRRASLDVNNTTEFDIQSIVVECMGVEASGRERTIHAYTNASVAAHQSRTIDLDFAASVFEDGDFSADRCTVSYDPKVQPTRKDGMWSRS